jgi:hypothetical protein
MQASMPNLRWLLKGDMRCKLHEPQYSSRGHWYRAFEDHELVTWSLLIDGSIDQEQTLLVLIYYRPVYPLCPKNFPLPPQLATTHL